MTTTAQKTVLFVDDDEFVLRALEASFEDDYNVITDISAINALKTLESTKVDILVSDQRMPEMLGYELLAKARKIAPGAIRILMTGYSDKQSILETINKGEVFRFIAKPWKIEEFNDVLQQASEASEIEHIESTDNETDSRKKRTLNEHWSRAKSTIGYSPSVLMHTREKYRKSLLQLASKSIDAKVFISQSLTASLDAIIKNNDIGIVFIEMNRINTDLISALAMLRRTRPEVVVIILTRSTDFEVAIKLINHGQAFRYLAEPIDLKTLQSAMLAGLIRHRKLKLNKKAARRYISDTKNLTIGSKIVRFFSKLSLSASKA